MNAADFATFAPKTGDVIVYRGPCASRQEEDNLKRLAQRLQAQGIGATIFALGPGQSIDHFTSEQLAEMGLQRIAPPIEVRAVESAA